MAGPSGLPGNSPEAGGRDGNEFDSSSWGKRADGRDAQSAYRKGSGGIFWQTFRTGGTLEIHRDEGWDFG